MRVHSHRHESHRERAYATQTRIRRPRNRARTTNHMAIRLASDFLNNLLGTAASAVSSRPAKVRFLALPPVHGSALVGRLRLETGRRPKNRDRPKGAGSGLGTQPRLRPSSARCSRSTERDCVSQADIPAREAGEKDGRIADLAGCFGNDRTPSLSRHPIGEQASPPEVQIQPRGRSPRPREADAAWRSDIRPTTIPSHRARLRNAEGEAE